MIDSPAISGTKLCDCPANRISCIEAKEWCKCQVCVWKFYYEAKDIRDKNLHPATFPVALARKVISLFTHKGELVVDPFVGSGTTLVAAQDLQRNAVGFDLQDKYIDLSNKRIVYDHWLDGTVNQRAIHDDSRNALKYLPPGSAKLVLTSPPYANMLNIKRTNKSRHSKRRQDEPFNFGKNEQYSQDPRDLGTLEINAYEQAMTDIFVPMHSALQPGGHCVINVSDLYMDKKRILVHVHVIRALERAGFEFRNTIIWDRTNLLNGVGIFGWPNNFLAMGAFEYILHFRKA